MHEPKPESIIYLDLNAYLSKSLDHLSVATLITLTVLGLTTRQPLCVILCRLPEKGRKEIVKEMKERDREERGTGMKVKNRWNKNIPLYHYLLQG